jgi:hypothetical protein
MKRGQVNPWSGVLLGDEKTAEDYLARATYEMELADKALASRRVGRQQIAARHVGAARVYQRLAREHGAGRWRAVKQEADS